MHALLLQVLLYINLHTRFEVPIFTDSKHTTERPKFEKNESHDSDQFSGAKYLQRGNGNGTAKKDVR